MAAESTLTPPIPAPTKYATPHGTRWQNELASGRGSLEYSDDPKFIGPWVLGDCVGKGASGRVRIAKHRRTGKLAAVKILPMHPSFSSRVSLNTQHARSEKFRLSVDREIITMKLMHHPNILRIFDVYEGDKELFLVLEYVEGGELFDFLVNRGKMDPSDALAYFKQIIFGLHYAHTFSIVHRDLKPENILIQSLNPPLIKIADWGMAAFSPPSAHLGTSCGSPHYASPEIIAGESYKGPASDIWSCGVILFALLTGRLPFDDKDVGKLLKKVCLGNYVLPQWVDAQAADLLSKMLVVDPRKRITMLDILAHPWMQNPTPGVICTLPPPPEELVRPITSLTSIDRDILESLRVICGKHVDTGYLRMDLLSPAGYGSVTKALYYLLEQHRRLTLQESGIDHDSASLPGKVVTKQYTGPSSQDTLSARLENFEPRKSLPSPKPIPTIPLPPTPFQKETHAEARPTRLHPPAPIGPRANPKQRPTSTPAHQSEFIPTVGNSLLPVPRPFTPVRTRSAPVDTPKTPDISERAHLVLPATELSDSPTAISPQATSRPRRSPRQSYHPDSRIPLFSTSPAKPVAYASAAGLPPIAYSPNFGYTPIRQSVGGRAGTHRPTVAVQQQGYSTRERSITADPMSQQPCSAPHYDTSRRRAESAAPHSRTEIDKENRSAHPRREVSSRRMMNKENWPGYTEQHALKDGPVSPKPRVAHGLGLDKASVVLGTGKIEKKQRPPPLELHNSAASETRSALTSPKLLLSPTTLTPVGELKGWFSNLFNWKQSHVLYSLDGPYRTRDEAARLLSEFGVAVENDGLDESGAVALRCVVEDGTNGAHKGVRFRVEFTALPPITQHSFHPLSPPIPAYAGTAVLARGRNITNTNGGGGGGFSNWKDAAGVGYESAMVLIQEKGSVTTFRTVHQRLRGEWKLDALQTPGAFMGTTPATQSHDRFVGYMS